MAEIPSTHYVKSDDVHIAYQVIGDGPLDLLFIPDWLSNIELYCGSGIAFEDRGDHDLKGLAESRRLYLATSLDGATVS